MYGNHEEDVYWGSETKWLGGDIRYAHGSHGVPKEHGVVSSDDDADGTYSLPQPGKTIGCCADGFDLCKPRRA